MFKKYSFSPEVAKKILLARDAILRENLNEAYHQLYSIADPEFKEFAPWKELEEMVECYDTKSNHSEAVDGY